LGGAEGFFSKFLNNFFLTSSLLRGYISGLPLLVLSLALGDSFRRCLGLTRQQEVTSMALVPSCGASQHCIQKQPPSHRACYRRN
jgi:hypothetical protein